MAELKQGVEYELSVKDSTRPGVESAKTTVEQGAKDMAKSAGSAAEEFKAGFSPMAAITAAITGNVNALSGQLLGLASRLKGVHMSMMQFSLYAAFVMAVVKAVTELVDWFREAARQAGQLKLDNAKASLGSAKEFSAAMAHNIEEARKNAEALTASLKGEIDALERLTKAQNDFAKAQELALAKSEEERRSIEAKYRSADAHNGRELSAARRAAEREALDGEIARLREELESAIDDQSSARRQAREAGRNEQRLYRRQTGWRTWWNGTGAGEEEIAKAKEWGTVRESATAALQDAIRRQQEIERRLESAEHRRALLDVDEEASRYSDAAEMQTELNEAWKEADEAEKRELEEIKEAAVEAAEEVKEVRLKALAEVKDTRMRDLREATEAEATAQQRLAAARQAVDRAWGWYRDKESLKAQLEEEKSEAAAQRQFEKDFEKLKDRRPDWESAKNLSLDQEAVRRVALARREETAAARDAAETAANTRRAADALEVIESAFQEGGE